MKSKIKWFQISRLHRRSSLLQSLLEQKLWLDLDIRHKAVETLILQRRAHIISLLGALWPLFLDVGDWCTVILEAHFAFSSLSRSLYRAIGDSIQRVAGFTLSSHVHESTLYSLGELIITGCWRYLLWIQHHRRWLFVGRVDDWLPTSVECILAAPRGSLLILVVAIWVILLLLLICCGSLLNKIKFALVFLRNQ